MRRAYRNPLAGALIIVLLWIGACSVVGGIASFEAEAQGAVAGELWPNQEFLVGAYNPPYAWNGPPYEDSVFIYYRNANFDSLLWVRDDDLLMQKVHEYGFKYLLDIAGLIGEDVLRGSPDGVPPEITDEMLRRLDEVIDKYRDDPNLIGYYICDEPFPSAFQNIAVVIQEIEERDPARFSFVNLWPYFEGEIGDDQYIEDFINITDAEVICSDRYNFFNGWDENEEYFAQLGRIRRHALRHGIQFYNIIQAVGTNGTCVGTPGCGDEYLEWRTPNRAEHRWLVYSSLTYGVHGIIWSHWDHEWGVTGNPGRDIIYPSIQSINAEISVLKEIMLHLTTAYVYHTDADVAPLGPFADYIEVPDDVSLVVGFFRDEMGEERYFMLMNKSYSEPAIFEARISSDLDNLHVFDVRSNRWEEVPFTNDATGATFAVRLREGGGKLYRFSTYRCCLPFAMSSYYPWLNRD